MEDSNSAAIRMAAFEWLREQIGHADDTLTRVGLEQGFEYKGIFKPAPNPSLASC